MKNTFPLFSVHNQQQTEEEEHHQDQQEQRQQQQEHKRQVGTRLEALFKYLKIRRQNIPTFDDDYDLPSTMAFNGSALPTLNYQKYNLMHSSKCVQLLWPVRGKNHCTAGLQFDWF